tara:strand:+ start:2026 stop:2250 length:225 start_codon:yes stop_codon:yes gene_type:complete
MAKEKMGGLVSHESGGRVSGSLVMSRSFGNMDPDDRIDLLADWISALKLKRDIAFSEDSMGMAFSQGEKTPEGR